jgi:hypothetical protein
MHGGNLKQKHRVLYKVGHEFFMLLHEFVASNIKELTVLAILHEDLQIFLYEFG